MLKTLKTSFYIIVSFLFALFLLEDAFQLYVRNYRSDLMPRYEKQNNPTLKTDKSGPKPKYIASPFFAYVSTDGNNYGFLTEEDFPLTRNKNTYVIAILGGSVANHLANYVFKHDEFKDKIKSSIPALKDKEIKVMGLALPGYKQPQQYLVLSYFIEQIDMIIQVDGWNEMTVAAPNNSPADYPMIMNLYSNQADAIKNHPAKWKIAFMQFIENDEILKKSMALFFLKNSFEYKLFEESHLQKPESIESNGRFQNDKEMVQTWSRYTKQEKHLLNANNKKGFFFVQASQYNPGSKVFTEDEKRIAVNPLRFKFGAPGFQLLRAEAKKINVYDLAEVFKNERGAIYIDDCCHVNEKGNQLVTDEIIKVISKNFKN